MLKNSVKLLVAGLAIGTVVAVVRKIVDKDVEKAVESMNRNNCADDGDLCECAKDCECGVGDCCSDCPLFTKDEE